MVAFLDLLGATVIRGGIILILLRLTLSMQDALYERTERAVLDRSMFEATVLVRHEIRIMGYHVTIPSIVELDTSRISFLADIDNDGTPDVVRYSLAPMTGPLDGVGGAKYFLNRSVNGGVTLPILRYVRRFRIDCFDGAGISSTSPSTIRSLSIILQTQSNSFFNGRYPSSAWQAQIFPPNL